MNKRQTPSFRQSGQAMIEYTFASLVLALLLGISLSENDSVLVTLARAFQTAYQRFTFAISLPI